MIICETSQLRLRHFESNDANFILRLYNQPAFLQHIGDRGIHTLDDAKQFIVTTKNHYTNHGFWLYLVEDIATGNPVGVNGLVKRDYLDVPDIGFAIDNEYWRHGYAFESSQAVLGHARELGLEKLYGITSPDNQSSIQLLLKLGFNFSKCDSFEEGSEPINLYQFNQLHPINSTS